MISQAKGRTRLFRSAALGLGAALVMAAAAGVAMRATPSAAAEGSGACAGDNGGIVLSPGFCATVFADNLGHVRHLAIDAKGVVYVNTWSGRYYANQPAPPGGFLVALKDSQGTGKADQVTRFGETAADGDAGGTGIALYKGYVYAESNDKIVRYQIPAGGYVPTGKPEVVLSGMPLGGDHPMHPFIIDAKGEIFVDMGTATNACQAKNRSPGVPGIVPCTETQTRGGIWRYEADKLDQKFSAAERYATGLRNGEGLSFDASGRLFATQHGRDQLPNNWPKLYPDLAHATELPAEELVELKPGGDYGWPTCYYDNFQKKLVLAPEYGGDGGKAVGVCAQKSAPAAAFPAHWAPNDMLIYKGKAFPGPYQGGAFIAFHGSWNRAPEPQAGYNVVYQPMAGGKASGAYVVFADGFAGGTRDPGKARFRPTGLQVGPDGALYIADDVKGRIWKVTYHGPAALAAIAAAPAVPAAAAANDTGARPPENGPLPVPPGATAAQVAAGDKLFHAQTCTGCHGSDAKGTPLGPDLTSGMYQWSDGGLAGITKTITTGVAEPKQFRSAMPPMGGAQLSATDLQSIAAYVWAVGHETKN
jgi:glucose/arabinose dehydrogenase/cytochrome c5